MSKIEKTDNKSLKKSKSWDLKKLGLKKKNSLKGEEENGDSQSPSGEKQSGQQPSETPSPPALESNSSYNQNSTSSLNSVSSEVPSEANSEMTEDVLQDESDIQTLLHKLSTIEKSQDEEGNGVEQMDGSESKSPTGSDAMNETSLLPYRRATIDVTNRPDLQNLKRGSMDPAFKSAKRVESELPSPAQDPADERSSAEESGSSDLMLQKQNKRLLRQLEEQVAKRLAIQKEYDKIKKELDLLKLENEKLRKELASYQGKQTGEFVETPRSSSPKNADTKKEKVKETSSHGKFHFATLRKNQILELNKKEAERPTLKRTRSRSTDATADATAGLFFPSDSALKDLLRDTDQLPFFISKGFHYLETQNLQELHNYFSGETDTTDIEKIVKTGALSNWKFNNPKQVAACLVKFFNALKEPLFPQRTYRAFQFWNEIEDENIQASSMKNILLYGLPSINRSVLKYITHFCHTAIQHSPSPDLMIPQLATSLFRAFFRNPNVPGEDPVLFDYDSQKMKEKPLTSITSFLINKTEMLYEEEKAIRKAEGEIYPFIQAIPLELLLEKFFDEAFCLSAEPEFASIFLLTHNYFFSNMKLTDFLISKFSRGNTKWDNRLQHRVLDLMHKWFSEHRSTLEDNAAYEKLKQFLQECEKDFERINGLKQLLYPRKRTAVNISQSQAAKFEFIEVDPTIIAQQITVIDHEALRAIPENELLLKAMSNPEFAPNFFKMCDAWNRRSLWVTSEIMKQEKKSKRAQVISYFIKLAEALQSLNNFHSCYAVITGLSHRVITKLEKTWEKVPKNLITTFQKLVDLFGISGNYKKYRQLVQNAHPPAIPYLALISKDLTANEENPSVLENGSVNWGKMREIWKIINRLRKFQQHKFTQIEIDTDMCLGLKFPSVLSEQDMLAMQYK